jgi:hypothetical protein
VGDLDADCAQFAACERAAVTPPPAALVMKELSTLWPFVAVGLALSCSSLNPVGWVMVVALTLTEPTRRTWASPDAGIPKVTDACGGVPVFVTGVPRGEAASSRWRIGQFGSRL